MNLRAHCRLSRCLPWLMTLVVCGAAPTHAMAQSATAIRNNGDPANRVDLVILGDGYTSTDIASGKYAQDVESFVQQMFSQDPYREYQNYYNVWRIDTASGQSGSDHPTRGVFKATAFDSTYDCSGVSWLICVNGSKVNAAVFASGIAANARDAVLVIVNDAEYGESGGSVAVASVNSAAVEIALHEFGHSFALLADEYGAANCNAPSEPPQVNATTQTDRALLKWASWVDAPTPIPTPGTPAGVPGLFAGAAHCDAGLYRPTYDSKMRRLNRPFEQINTEQHVRRIYNLVSPIDSWSPAAASIVIPPGQQQTFAVTVPQPTTHELSVVWLVDNIVVAAGTQFTTTGLSPGAHQISATVSDYTPLVQNDPTQLLTETHLWTVTQSGITGMTIGTNEPSPQLAGSTVTFTAAGTGGTAPYSYRFFMTADNWATYALVRDWSTAPTFAWTPAVPGTYQMGVWARSAGNATEGAEAAAVTPFQIGASMTLTVAVQGSGSVTTGDGITCPSVACSHLYASGEMVTFHATPLPGFVFGGWSSSACSGGSVLMSGPVTCGATFLPAGGTPRRGTLNLSGAAKGDVFTYNATTGAYTEQLSDGLGHFGEIRGTWPAGLQVFPADFNNDGQTDFLVYAPGSGAWSQALNTGSGGFSYVGGLWPTGLQMYLVDLNGDHRTDLFAYNPGTGLWSRCLTPSSGTGFTCTSGTWPTGVSLYPADFNADGLTDFFAYNASTGVWSLAVNTGTSFTYSNGIWPSGLTLLPGDFNGDGRSDFFVSNPATGAWSVATTQANLTFTYVSGTWSVGWTFVTGDFNGDGKTDLFLYNPAQGWWNEAVSNGLASAFTLTPGTWSAGLQLQVTDLNGDGQSDVVLYAPASGAWYQALHAGAGVFAYGSGNWSPGLTVIGNVPKIP